MPNIRILATAVLKIFCSQGCSYTKCPKKGNNSTENLRNRFKSWSVHLHLGLLLYAKYQDSSFSSSPDILFTRFFIHSRKRGITPEPQGWWRKKKIRVRLFFMYMPHIKFQDSSISGSWVSQLPSITDRQTDGQTDGQAQTNMPPQLLRSWGHKNKRAVRPWIAHLSKQVKKQIFEQTW